MTAKPPANIRMRDIGAGEPALIFVHGFACALEDWDAQIAVLSKRYRCVAVDLPGHGGSAAGTRATMDGIAGVLSEVRRAVGAERVVLVGHSLGVRNVIDSYLAEPEGVAGLVLVDGRFYDGDPGEVAARTAALVDGPGGYVEFARKAFAGMFTERADPALRDRVVARAQQLDPGLARALLIESILWDSTKGRSALARLKLPVLHLQSSDLTPERKLISLQPDSWTQFMALVADLVPGAVVKAVPGIGHFTMLEAAGTVTSEIDAFVTGLE